MIDNALQYTAVVNLGPIDLIPIGEGKSFVVGDLEVAVFRMRSEQLFATQARCPHRGGPLADGTLGGMAVQCPLHGFSFDLRSGQPLGNDCSALETLRVDLNASREMELHLPPMKLSVLRKST